MVQRNLASFKTFKANKKFQAYGKSSDIELKPTTDDDIDPDAENDVAKKHPNEF
jgi:hypothetical protein